MRVARRIRRHTRMHILAEIDVRAIHARLNLTQEELSLRSAPRTYLTVIGEPKGAARALAEARASRTEFSGLGHEVRSLSRSPLRRSSLDRAGLLLAAMENVGSQLLWLRQSFRGQHSLWTIERT